MSTYGDGTYGGGTYGEPSAFGALTPAVRSFPAPRARIAFDSDPTEAPVWMTVTPYLRSFRSDRGRDHELERVKVGTCDAVFKNDDGRFDPGYAGGAYFPNVKPMRRIQIDHTWDDVEYATYGGYAEDFTRVTPGPLRADAKLPCVDGLAVLALAQVNDAADEELTGERIDRVLSLAGFTLGGSWLIGQSQIGIDTIIGPVGSRSIMPGQTTVQATTLDKANAVAHIRTIEEAENGLFFMDASNVATFHDRHRRVAGEHAVSLATFGDDQSLGSDELPYVEVILSTQTLGILNEVRITRDGGTEQVASDAESKAEYFLRSLSIADSPVTTDNEALSQANWRLARQKQPGERITRMILNPIGDVRLWPHVLGREIGDRVTVIHRTPYGHTITQESNIEAISHDVVYEGIDPDGDHVGIWTTEWALSPAEFGFWIIGSSLIGVDTRVAY